MKRKRKSQKVSSWNRCILILLVLWIILLLLLFLKTFVCRIIRIALYLLDRISFLFAFLLVLISSFSSWFVCNVGKKEMNYCILFLGFVLLIIFHLSQISLLNIDYYYALSLELLCLIHHLFLLFNYFIILLFY